MGYVEKRVRLVQEMNAQVRRLMEEAHRTGGCDPYPRPKAPLAVPEHLRDRFDGNETLVEEALEAMLEEETKRQEAEVEDRPLGHPDGFTLRINYSGVHHPDAGFGVWVEGEAAAGTVVGFYPGAVHLPDDVHRVAEGNEYMISRYDGTVVDGKGWAAEAVLLRRRLRQLAAAGGSVRMPSELELNRYRNPFAVANYINHPPPGAAANVMCMGYDFPAIDDEDALPEDLLSFVPNRNAKEQKTLSFWFGGGAMRSVVAVLTRPVRDEELFLNYRFNPRNPYPAWYVQPDEDEALRRWGKVSLL